MKAKYILLPITLLFVGTSYAKGEYATVQYSLEQSFELARKRSETLAISSEDIDQAEARINQARATYKPSLSATASHMIQERPESQLAQNVSPSEQSTVGLSISQNLFNGFKDVSNLKAQQKTKEANQNAYYSALKQLYVETAEIYYTVLMYREDLKNIADQIQNEVKRKSELTTAKKFGRARDADILSIDASIANLEASASSTKKLLTVYEESYSVLTGLPPDSKLGEALETDTDIGSLQDWTRAIDSLPEMKRAKADIEAAEQSARSARSGYLPKVDIAANYYGYKSGFNSDVNWDATINLKVPLYDGGATSALIQEENSRVRQKELSLQLQRKKSEQAIRTAFKSVTNSREQMKKLERASELARRNFELLRSDNRKGIASNTDVLTALKSSQESSRSASKQKYQLLNDLAVLKAESGKLQVSE